MTIMLLPAPLDRDHPDVIRWRVGPGLIRTEATLVAGDPADVGFPPAVADLVGSATLRSVHVAPGAIETTFAAGHTARTSGARVRAALFEALSQPGGWPEPGVTEPDGGPDVPAAIAAVRRGGDRELEAGVREVLAGEFGLYTAAHGGRVELVDVTGGVVTVALRGQCHGCAAASITLRENLATHLRRLPAFVELRTTGEDNYTSPPGRTMLGSIRLRSADRRARGQ
ncbi:NifU family protein [Gordonia sp. DT30]|uniref:NifU family protein n=1 Tax=Gordonia sp. DT30 TaxID=3416546 RepID=UPI003CE833A7